MSAIKGIQIIDNSNEILSALNNQLESALEEIGQTIEENAKANTPVDTGKLRDSIQHTVDIDNKVVNVGSGVDYAIFVEEGTKKMKGHHMLRDAVMAHNSEYRGIIEKYLKS